MAGMTTRIEIWRCFGRKPLCQRLPRAPERAENVKEAVWATRLFVRRRVASGASGFGGRGMNASHVNGQRCASLNTRVTDA